MLNADDDFVCPAELAQPDVIVGEQPGALLLVTRSGSHVAFNEGVTFDASSAGGSYTAKSSARSDFP